MVRADGKIFWAYSRGKHQCWVTWEWAMKHREDQKVRNRQYREKHRERLMAENRRWREENAERHRANARAWGKKNKRRVAERKARRREERKLEDPIYELRERLRARCSAAIRNRGYYKGARTTEILGADWLEIKTHLEGHFLDGMTWENRSEWHIDHIRPLASAKTEDELIALCHYTNLQPLWAADNLRKGARYEKSSSSSIS